ncbi:MAG: hypothetical protein GXP49_11000 [Deltaproteobacteria bacterium]|nr:hypothetical protein [Deltaproteobacteria bacterium]
MRSSLFCLVLGLAVFFQACSTAVYHDLDEKQANKIIVALAGAGIPAQKVKEGRGNASWSIHVQEDQAERAWRLLESLNMPRQEPVGFKGIYSDKSLIPTQQEERVRYAAALSGEMEKTLESLDRIVDAHVNLVLDNGSASLDEVGSKAVKASVLVKYLADDGQEPPLKRAEIARLVSGGVDGLAPDKVVVVMAVVKGRKVLEESKAAGANAGMVGISPRYLKIGMIVLSLLVLAMAAMLVQSRLALHRARPAD